MNILSLAGRLGVFLTIGAIIAILAYALFGNRTFDRPSPLLGRVAPDFTLTLFDGERVSLSDYRGQAVLLNFWASWCGPCRLEAPALENSWRRYRDKPVVFIGVNVWDDKSSALDYLRQTGGGFINGFDQKGEIAVSFGVAGVPETYFISPSGKITDKYTGALTEETIDGFLRKAMSGVGDEITINTN
ncbi:MAG: TlpA family protein disulfide reductase [Deltaproteobacteria bacterium]